MKSNNSKAKFEYLKKKWSEKHQSLHQKLFDKHLRHIAMGSIGGMMLFSTPALALPTTAHSASANSIAVQVSEINAASSANMKLADDLSALVPKDVRKLTSEEESKVSEIIGHDLKVSVSAEIDGKRLNRSYGLIGGEQHLYRYPGDSLPAHAKTASDWAMYGGSGIAPGLGAWGYFAPSKSAFNSNAEQKERYYLAVQTFLSPGFAENVAAYRDFYRFRKMLVVNPKTGQAVVAVIGDAGPGESTGKHLGGSPEVMEGVGLATGPRKGAVLYFFINDPDDKIPLGPLKVDYPLIAQE